MDIILFDLFTGQIKDTFITNICGRPLISYIVKAVVLVSAVVHSSCWVCQRVAGSTRLALNDIVVLVTKILWWIEALPLNSQCN